MSLRLLLCSAAGAVLLGACSGSGGEAPVATPTPAAAAAAPAAPAAAPAAPAASTAAAATSPRAPDEDERSAMVAVLSAEAAPERTAWIAVTPGAPEPAALANALKGVFESAGWKVQMQTVTGMSLKPGVSFLSAEETPPSWAETALRGMQASGIEVKAATGYRPYYEEKKKSDPNWVGVPLAADQAFVIVVGPTPAA